MLLFLAKINTFPILFPFCKWKLLNKENKAAIEGGKILICNHTSKLDVPMLSYIFFKKKIYYPASATMFQAGKLPSAMFRALGAVRVDTNELSVDMLAELADKLDKNQLVCVFPEGKCNKEDKLLEFQCGVGMLIHALKKNVVPICLDGNYGLFKRCKVAIGDEIPYEELQKFDDNTLGGVQLMMSSLRDRMQQMLDEIRQNERT